MIDTLAPTAEIDRRALVSARLSQIRAAITACGVETRQAEYKRLGVEYNTLLNSRPIRAWRDLSRTHPDNAHADKLNAGRQVALDAMNAAITAQAPLREIETIIVRWLSGESVLTFDRLMEQTEING